MRIGVLALQGAFAEHMQVLHRMGIQAFEIRQPSDLRGRCDGLILPGGESTVIGKLLGDLALLTPIREMIQGGLPVLGTCAGLILLSKTLENAAQPGLGLMDIVTVRNGYGRQLGSFCTVAPFAGREIPMCFIRAPYIKHAAQTVQVLARVDNRIVAARQENMLVTAFHPELAADRTVYEYFFGMISARSGSTRIIQGIV